MSKDEGDMPMFSFVISHYAATPKHNDILAGCIESIRKTHSSDTPIHIIDSKSPCKIVLMNILQDPYVFFHKNPFPSAGEVGALYWYATHPVSKYAAVIHDSMRCFQDMSKFVTKMQKSQMSVSFLWFFLGAHQYHIKHIEKCFRTMSNDEELLASRMALLRKGTRNIDWVGCFGNSILVSQERLAWYSNTLHIFTPLPIMNEKPYREAYERILGIIFAQNEKNLMIINGNIFRQPYAADIEAHLEDLTYEELKNKIEKEHDHIQPMFKFWVGR